MNEQAYRIKDSIELALETGESHFREFKSAFEGPEGSKKPRQLKKICKNISKTLVAFANADGGELIIGIEDDSSLTGIPHKDEDIQKMLQAVQTHIHKTTPLPEVKHIKIEYKGKTLLYFQTSKSTETIHLTSEGLCLQRRDRESVPIAPHTISFEREEIVSRQFDRKFIHNASVSDLNLNLIEDVASSIINGLSPEKCLQHLDLAEYTHQGLKLRQAALLLFSSDISKWHSRCQVRFIKVVGKELLTGDQYNAQDVGLERGNILDLIFSTWEKLRPFLVQTKLSSGAVFETKVMYPELACQEAIINAIAHRDYSVQGSGIEVYIYDDRLEIKSPGMLLSTITIESINKQTGVHESRNSLISRVLREKGYMRELGEGMRRIFNLLKKSELSPPELLSENKYFTITLHHKSVYNEEQKLWLDLFQEDKLSSDEKTIVLLGYNKNIFSAHDIWESVGIVDTEHYRQLVQTLQKKRVISAKYGTTAKAKTKAKHQKIPFKKFKRYYILTPDKRADSRQSFDKTNNDDTDVYKEYNSNRIYVCNLPYSTSNEDLYELFEKVGEIADATISINFQTNRPRGFGFVEFVKKSSAEEAIKKYNGTILNGRRIAISLAYKR